MTAVSARSGRAGAKLRSRSPGELRRGRSIPPGVRSNVRSCGGVGEIRRSLPRGKAIQETARLLEAASDPSRLRLLAALDRSSLCPCLLRQIAPMKHAVLSYHLKVLRDVGLVSRASVSNFRVYALTARGRRLLSAVRETSPGSPR